MLVTDILKVRLGQGKEGWAHNDYTNNLNFKSKQFELFSKLSFSML